jgi:hypothetical protein
VLGIQVLRASVRPAARSGFDDLIPSRLQGPNAPIPFAATPAARRNKAPELRDVIIRHVQ